jgi:hypothetical protein
MRKKQENILLQYNHGVVHISQMYFFKHLCCIYKVSVNPGFLNRSWHLLQITSLTCATWCTNIILQTQYTSAKYKENKTYCYHIFLYFLCFTVSYVLVASIPMSPRFATFCAECLQKPLNSAHLTAIRNKEISFCSSVRRWGIYHLRNLVMYMFWKFSFSFSLLCLALSWERYHFHDYSPKHSHRNLWMWVTTAKIKLILISITNRDIYTYLWPVARR